MDFSLWGREVGAGTACELYDCFVEGGIKLCEGARAKLIRTQIQAARPKGLVSIHLCTWEARLGGVGAVCCSCPMNLATPEALINKLPDRAKLPNTVRRQAMVKSNHPALLCPSTSD